MSFLFFFLYNPQSFPMTAPNPEVDSTCRHTKHIAGFQETGILNAQRDMDIPQSHHFSFILFVFQKAKEERIFFDFFVCVKQLSLKPKTGHRNKMICHYTSITEIAIFLKSNKSQVYKTNSKPQLNKIYPQTYLAE